MVNLALVWAEAYNGIHPEAQISVTGGGSGTGIAALLNGTVDIANASREMKAEEIQQAQAAGFTPIAIVVAKDAIAIIVNKDNPLEQLTLAQLASIYKGEITNWSQLVAGYDHPIVALSRESNSGTHVYFLEVVVRLGSKDDKSIFAPTVLLLPSSEGIMSEVKDNPNAIGYDGLGYITDEVKKIAVAANAQSVYIIPDSSTVLNGEYPISRDLYMYTRGEPAGVVRQYIEWILSAEGQAIVAALGFVPIIGGNK